MVYKKYVYKRGRRHGPYYYHSYRKGDSVKKVYIGGRKEYKEWLKKEEKKPSKIINKTTSIYHKHNLLINKKLLFIPIVILLILIAGFLIYNQLSLVGKVSLEMRDTYVFGENISGSLRLNLKEGEFLPMDAKLIIEQDGAISEIVLSELLQSNNEGNFYIENQQITGEGQGYGFVGTKTRYPTLNFKLKIYDSSEEEPVDEEEVEEATTEETPIEESNVTQAEEQTPQTEETQEQVEQIPSEEIPVETPQGTSVEQTQGKSSEKQQSPEKKEEKSESETTESVETNEVSSESVSEGSESLESSGESSESGEESTETSSPITGEAVKETEKEKKVSYVDGSVSKDNTFSYTLDEGKTATIKKNSVRTEDNKKLNDDAVTLQISGQEAEVTTDYSISEQGFGVDYVGGETHYIDVSLELLGILAQQGTLTIKLVYQDINLAETSKEIEVVSEIPEKNVTEIENITIINETIANITIANETITNVTAFNETFINLTVLNITTKQYKAIINRPVKWIKAVNIGNISAENLTLELPKKAQNISIKTGGEVQIALDEADNYEQLINETDRTSIITGQVTGDVSLEIRKKQGIITRFWNWITKAGITGNVISEEETQGHITETNDSKLVDLDAIVEQTQETDIGVEYYTESPISTEENTTTGKLVTVYTADELNYTDILAYTEIPNGTIKNENNNSIKVYQYVWVEEATTEVNKTQENITEQVAQEAPIENATEQPTEEAPIENATEQPTEEIPTEQATNETQKIINESIETAEITINESITEINESSSLLTGQAISGEEVTENIENESLIEETISEISNESTDSNLILTKVSVNFTAYDLDFDGFIDYIEWIVPHLSNQTYNIVISTTGYTGTAIKDGNYYHLAISTTAPYNSLVGYWNFDADAEETLTTTHYDFSPSGANDGTGGGGANASRTTNLYGNYLQLDGSVDYVNLTGWFALDDYPNGTVSVWAKPLTDFGTDYIISARDGATNTRVYITTNQTDFTGYFMNSDIGSFGKPIVGSWYHIVWSWNNTNVDIYLNSVYNKTVAYTLSSGSNTYQMFIGAYALDVASGNFNGAIDEVMIFNTSLNSSQISAIYQNTSARFVSSGTLNVNQTNITSQYYTTLDVNSTFKNKLNTNISLALSYYTSGWNNTAMQNITGYNSYTINKIVTNVTFNFTLLSDSNSFYTPLLNDSTIVLNATYDDIPPTLNVTSPVNTSYYNNSGVLLNVSSSESGTGMLVSVLDNSLVSWWRMDDINASGDVVDYLGRNNGSKKGNAVQTDAGKFGKGFSFDGSGDYVNVTNNGNLNFNSSGTISMWIYPHANGYMLRKDNNGVLLGYTYAYKANQIYFVLGGQYTDTDTNTITTNVWQHVSIVFNSSGRKIYINGIDKTRVGGTNTALSPADNSNIILGEYTADFNGTIDEVMIFNRSLSADEIVSLYNATKLSHTETISDGSHTFKAYTQDLAANINQSDLISFGVDTVYPSINFSLPTPVNGSTQSGNAIYVNLTTNDTNQHYAFTDFDRSLVGWWRMDDINGTGSPTDISSYSNNGTKVGNAVQTDAGYYGKGFAFDGVNSYINSGGSIPDTLTFPMAISLWFKTDVKDATAGSLISDKNGYAEGFWLDSPNVAGTVTFSWENLSGTTTSVNSQIDLADGVWHHVVVTLNSTTGSMYVDNVLKHNVSNTVGGNITSPAQQLYIGKHSNVGTEQYFNGTIDDVLIFNRSLSAAEISALYNATANQYYNNFTSLSDATHTFTGYAVDKAGNKNQTGQRSVTVDTINPGVNITYPLNTTYDNYVTAINYTVSGGSSCWYGNGSINYTAVSAGVNWTGLSGNSSKGSNTWTVYCNDTANNLNSSSVTFVVDNTNPSLNVSNPVNTSYYNNSGVLFNVSSTEVGTGMLVPVLDNSLVSWWRMDDINSSGDVVDYMGINNGSKQGNAAQTDSGKFGKGFVFDGAGDYINLTDISRVEGVTNLTISAWVYIKGPLTADQAIVSKYGNGDATESILFWFDDVVYGQLETDTFRFYIEESGDTCAVWGATSDAKQNQWQHVVGVFEVGSEARIYIDGAEGANSPQDCSAVTSIRDTSIPLRIGGDGTTGGKYFNGTIDEVMVFNRSLSADEIVSLYNATKLSHIETIADGSHTFKAYTQDLAANINQSNLISFGVDTAFPTINFSLPTPANGTTQSANAIYVNLTTSDTNQHYAFADFNNDVVLWMRMDDLNATNDPTDLSHYCYDNETEILTLEEVDCSEVNCNDEDVVCEFDDNENNELKNKEKGSENVTRMVTDDFSPEYDNYRDNSYINVSDNKKENATNVASTVTQIFTDYNNFNENKYINVSDEKNKKDSNGMVESYNLLIPDNNCNKSKYLNVSVCFNNSCAGMAEWLTQLADTKCPSGLVGSIPTPSAVDTSTRKCHKQVWKLFSELNENEKVMTLNQETGEKEWQLPSEKQVFEHDNEMYKIVLEDGSDLLVSPEHRVYAGENKRDYNNLNSFIKSSVVNTSTLDCCLNASSSDQTGNLKASAKAKYGSSFVSSLCGESLLASERNLEYFCFEKVLTDLFNNENKNSNSDSSIFENLITLSLFSNNSFNTKSGEISLHSAFNNSSITYLLTDFDLKNENNIEASIINDFGSIFDYSPCCLATLFFSSFANSEICPSVNLLLDNISSAIENSNLLTNCLTTLAKANPNLSFNSSGTSTLITTSAILTDNIENLNYINLSVIDIPNFSLKPITDVYSDINNGKEVYFLDKDNKPVKVKSITKEPYSGKIYDVDVDNDIVLVRRKNSTALWSGNSNNGSKVGNAVQTDAGYFGKGFVFDGAGDYVNIGTLAGDISFLNGTVSLWYKLDATTGSGYIFRSNVNVRTYIVANPTSNRLELTKGNPAKTLYCNGCGMTGWHHLVLDWKQYNSTGGNMSVYFDGALSSSGLFNDITTAGTVAYLGSFEGSTGFFNGSIDEVLIFNRSLSATEISALYNATASQYYNNFTSLADGQHNFTGYAVDKAGNKNQTEERQVMIDTVNPGVNVTFPLNTTYDNYVTALNYTVTGGQSCWYSNGSINYTAVTAGVNWTGLNGNSTKGSNTWTVYCNDTANNLNSSSVTFSIDNVAPSINFSLPTPANGSTQSANAIYVNLTTTDTNQHYAFVDFDRSLVGWWRMDDLNGSSDPTDLSHYCYDNETEILTEEGWRLFDELNGSEKVATLNQETGETEYQKPIEYQEFAHNDDMYKIILEDGSDLLVSEEHRVYSESKNLSSSSVVNTFTEDCSLKCLSLDQIGILSSNANAKKGTSVLCEINLSAFNLLDCEGFLNSINSGSNDNLNLNSSLEIRALEEMVLEYLSSSFNKSLGENNSNPNSLSNSAVYDSDLNKENMMLLSTTNFIFYLDFFNMSSFNFRPNSMQSSSLKLEFSNPSLNCSNASSCLILFKNDSLANALQLSHANLSIFFFTSSGTDSVTDTILTSNMFNTFKHVIYAYKSFYEEKKDLSQFSLHKITDVYSDINNGREVYFLDSENKPVKVKNITKEPYSGRIYDVDVENDIVLVRRKNSKGEYGNAVWSGNSNNGSKKGNAAQTDAGYYGKGFVFDGAGDYVDFPDAQQTIPDGSNFTISAWVYASSSIATARDIFGMSDGGSANRRAYSLTTVTNGFAAIVGNSSNTIQANCAAVSLNTWYHLVAVFNRTGVLCYTNGIAGGSAANTLSGTVPKKNTGSSEVMGAGYEGLSGYFNGSIDEVIVFNRSLSAAEILALYNATASQYYNNYTGLAEGTHTFTGYAVDKAGNKNQTDARQVTIDTVNPGVNLTYPLNISYDNYVTAINYTVSGGSSCWYSNGSINYTSVSAGVNWTGLSGNSTKGSNTWTVYCNDTANNLNSSSVTFVIDNVVPSINFSLPTPSNATTQSSNSIYVNLTTSDTNQHYAFTDFDRSLVGWWRMDDINSSGSPTDLSSYSNNGTKVGQAAQTDAGYFGKGFVFDGAGDYVTAGIISSLDFPTSNNITISAWIKTSVNANQGIAVRLGAEGATNKGWIFRTLTTDRLYLYARNTTDFKSLVATGTDYDDGNWHHVVGVMSIEDGADSAIYFDGVSVKTGDLNITPQSTSSDTRIGVGRSDGSSSMNYFNGTIDEVMIFNRTLSSQEILALYNATASQYYNNFTGLSDATHTFTGYAVDKAGNKNQTEQRQVTIDSVKPGVNLTYPLNISYDNYVTAINYTVSGGSSCWYSNGSINYTSVSAGVNWTGLNGNSTKGSNTWTVYCNDTANNLNSSSVTFIVDNIAPTINFSLPTPANGSTQSANAIYVNLTTSDTNQHYAFTDFDRSLVGWWRMDDVNGTGSPTDISSYSNNGTKVGNAVQTDAGYYGKGFSFDGAGDYVNVADSNTINITGNQITVSAWVYPKAIAPASYNAIACKHTYLVGGYCLWTDWNFWEFRLNYNNSLKAISTTPVLNTWQMITGVYNTTDIILYVNGVQKTKTTITTTILPTTQALGIGYDGSYYWNGSIDEVIVFNRSLSAAEILALYNATASQYYNNFTGLSDATHTFRGYAVDKAGNKNQTSQRSVTTNVIPTVSLLAPVNGSVETNRTPEFNWTGSDTGGGPSALQYEINITCYEGSSIVSAGSIYKNTASIGAATSYIPAAGEYLKCLSDNQQIYNWTVRAYDGLNYSDWAVPHNLSIQSLITISLPVSSIDFGSMNPGASNDTTDGSPAPLVLQNDGNAELNISVNFTDLFETAENPSDYYRYKIRNTTLSCFALTNSQTAWAQAPNSTTASTQAINKLNFTSGYQTGCNNASIDIYVKAPSKEPGGAQANKTSTITFISSLGEAKVT